VRVVSALRGWLLEGFHNSIDRRLRKGGGNAEYAEVMRLALGAPGPGWKPWMNASRNASSRTIPFSHGQNASSKRKTVHKAVIQARESDGFTANTPFLTA